MVAGFGGRRRSNSHALRHVLVLSAGALLATGCATPSYDAAAIEASQNGDQKTAANLAKKQVERYSGPDNCSSKTTLNCGTLALAYGSLAEYQILGGDRTSGEGSFIRAKSALNQTDKAYRPSAVAMVYRDVSEAYWKTGDRPRAIAVIKEGRTAGADEWLFSASAAKSAFEETAPPSPPAPALAPSPLSPTPTSAKPPVTAKR
jgi:hypothetical protein